MPVRHHSHHCPKHTSSFLHNRIRTAPAPADLFANSSVSAAAAQRLAPLFEPGKHHPLEGTRGAEPHAVASLLLLYLQSLPHPIVPPKYYYTYVALNGEPHFHTHTNRRHQHL